jgi:hypothetical protein
LIALIEVFGLALAAWLGIFGGILEIAGFGLVAVELVRAQRKELGHAGPFQFILTWARWIRLRWRRLMGKSVTHYASATMTAGGTISGRGKARAGTSSNDVADRLRVLEENFERLDNEVDRHRRELDARIDEETAAQQAALAEFRSRVETRESEERTAFANSAKLQWLGIALFVLGAMASAAANVVGAS